jgi:hypothetical protein
MSIVKRLIESLDRLDDNDAEGALIPASIAVDATASQFYGAPGRKSFKTFIHDNMKLISRCGLNGCKIENLNLQVPQDFVAKFPQMHLLDARGLCSLQELFYHVVRCGLVHEAELHPMLVFKDEARITI